MEGNLGTDLSSREGGLLSPWPLPHTGPQHGMHCWLRHVAPHPQLRFMGGLQEMQRQAPWGHWCGDHGERAGASREIPDRGKTKRMEAGRNGYSMSCPFPTRVGGAEDLLSNVLRGQPK